MVRTFSNNSLQANVGAFAPTGLHFFELLSVEIKSGFLKGNPLGDPHVRRHPILLPKELKNTSSKKIPLVVYLSGFSSKGEKALGWKGFDESFLEKIERLTTEKKIAPCAYLFVDAWTFWGGSQFLDSPGSGRYESHIVRELVPEVLRLFDIDEKRVALLGSSSGGYGALHLGSKYPKLFPWVLAQAPDAKFEYSLLPDLVKALPNLEKYSHQKLVKLHRGRRLHTLRNGFSLLNAIAMSACYSPGAGKDNFDFPLELGSGRVKSRVWNAWRVLDPVNFLPRRTRALKKLRGIYLQVGKSDEFSLQYGARELNALLKKMKLKNYLYEEFDGGHFDCGKNQETLLTWWSKKINMRATRAINL